MDSEFPHYRYDGVLYYFDVVDGEVTRAFTSKDELRGVIKTLNGRGQKNPIVSAHLKGFERGDLDPPGGHKIWQIYENPYIFAVQRPDGMLMKTGFGSEEEALAAITARAPSGPFKR